MKVHVTGGSGFLGGAVIPRLLAAGHAVTALARSTSSADRVRQLGAQPVDGDLDRPETLAPAFEAGGSEALVNLASLGFGHAETIVRTAEEAGLKRAVFVSTTAVFTSLNPASKAVRLAAEDTIQASALDWTIVRPTMIYGGPGDRNMGRLLRFLRRSPAVPLPGGGRRLQQPVHVEDLADAIVTCLKRAATIRQTYDLAGPDPLTLRQVIGQAAEAVGRRPVLVPVPLGPAVAGCRLYEKVSSRPRIKAEQLERLGEDKAFDISFAQRDLDYRPRTFREGIVQEWQAIR